jgi:hypothetical protein
VLRRTLDRSDAYRLRFTVCGGVPGAIHRGGSNSTWVGWVAFPATSDEVLSPKWLFGSAGVAKDLPQGRVSDFRFPSDSRPIPVRCPETPLNLSGRPMGCRTGVHRAGSSGMLNHVTVAYVSGSVECAAVETATFESESPVGHRR